MATKKPAKKAARKPNAAFMKPMKPDDVLAEVVGDKPIPRTEITKKLWAYIKKNGLQDSKNKRNIKKKIISLLLLHFQIPMRLIAICKYFVLFFKIIQV